MMLITEYLNQHACFTHDGFPPSSLTKKERATPLILNSYLRVEKNVNLTE
jgi:hypothetical protein